MVYYEHNPISMMQGLQKDSLMPHDQQPISSRSSANEAQADGQRACEETGYNRALFQLLESEQAARAAAELTAARIGRLQQITAAFAEALTAQQVGEVFLGSVMPALGGVAGGISLLSDDGAWLDLLCTAGSTSERAAAYQRLPLSAPIPYAHAVRSGEALWFESGRDLVAHYPALASLPSISAGAVANLPLVVNRRAIGVLALQYELPHQFHPDERDFTVALTQQCAQALERARLYEANERARATAEEAVELRDTFLSVAAHELRNPLTSLTGQAQLLQRRLRHSADERDQHSIGVIVAQAERLAHMIGDLLDASRIERGYLTLAREPLDLAPLLQRIADELAPTFAPHILRYEASAAPLPLLGDPMRLEQVFVNLLQNAMKYSPDGGVVTFSAARVGQEARITVRDSGIGIPADALPQLFQRFFRAANAGASRFGGLGVGLYVVKEIVALHGGAVDVASVEGQGSTFTVTLPLAT